jgi:hypothetical protein
MITQAEEQVVELLFELLEDGDFISWIRVYLR